MPLRVAIDCTSLYGSRTGVGVFCAELLAGLAARPDVDPVAFAITLRGRRRLNELVPPGVSTASGPAAARPYRALWRHRDAPPLERWIDDFDIVHGPNFVVPPSRSAAEVTTVHDLSPLHFPELADPNTRQYETYIRRSLARGGWIHTPSQFVADEVVDRFGADPERVVAIHQGVVTLGDGPGTTAVDGQRIAGAERYLLALGTVEPRKNLPALVAAFDQLATRHTDLRLVIAGPERHGAEELGAAIRDASHGDRIVRTSWVSDEQRAALLRGAAVFVYPSKYEGFGFPPLEAQSVNTPVVTTSAGSLPEVVGDGARNVQATSGPELVNELAAAIGKILNDAEAREAIVNAGTVNVARFTWTRCADEMVALYRRAATA